MSILAAMVVPHPPLIIPAVGGGEEQKIQRTIDAYHKVMERAAALRPDTVVVTSPHTVMYADYFHISPGSRAEGNFGQFRAAQVRVTAEYDEALAARLSENCAAAGLAAGFLGEKEAALDHGTMIPLYFLQQHFPKVRVVRIGLSGLSAAAHYQLGQQIAAAAGELGRRVIVIASGDLSHKLKEDGPYGFAAAGPVFDQRMRDCLQDGDFLELLETSAELADAAAECGLRSFWIMAGALDGRAVSSELLSYEGPFGVGYGVAWFMAGGAEPGRTFGGQLIRRQQQRLTQRREHEDGLVSWARCCLETFVRTKQYAQIPADLPAELTTQRAAVFVSLQEDGRLRGCIGTILPTRSSMAEEILYNAVSAGMNDPRFPAVQEDELSQLVYHVDVLTRPERIDSPQQLDVKRYGVIVEAGDRRGLLLPDLSGVDSVEQQVSIARQKGNIAANEPVQLWRFEVVRHQ